MPETLHTSEGSRIATLTQALRLRASVTPERRAYTFLADGEEETGHLDYRELDERARAIAAALRRTCAVGDRALLLYPPGLDFVAAFFGCLYAGVIAVPAYPPRSPRMLPRLAAILEDSSPAVALSTSGAAARVAGWLAKEGSRALSWLATDEIPAERAAEWRDPELPDAAIAFLQYTSGSTSTPKGVMVSHGNLAHNQRVIAAACDHTADSVFVSWLPLYHDLGLIGNLLQATWVGAPCVLMSPVAFLQNPSRWLRAISQYGGKNSGGTTSGGPNFAYELCLRKVAAAERERLDLSSWRVAFNGAEPVRATTMARFSDGFAAAGLRREALYPCYGLAEATLMVSGGRQDEVYVARGYAAAALAEHRAEPAAGPAGARELVGSGRVLLDLRVAIVEPEATVALPAGRVGEIWVTGDSVARGYWNRPEESDRTFGARLAGEPGTWLRTGDLGFLDRGELFITGRVKDLIILRGRNHYPQDIELTAERAHPALRAGSGAAFSVEAEGEERLVVVYEVDRHAEALPEIAEAVRRAVAEEHEAVVHEVVLVPQGGVPKTTSGKIQRRACRDLYLAAELHPLGSSRLDDGAEPEPAEGPLRDALLAAPASERMAIAERWLGRAFARLARLSRETAKRLDPERALTGFGLDSLVAVELKNAVEDEVGVALPIAGLLEGMSLREAALRIVDPVVEGATEALEVVAGPAAGEHPLSWGQRALWFLHRLAPESAAYNIAGAARLAPGTDRAALARALQALVDRHPGLRATFAATPEGPVQRIPERADVALIHEDARGWSDLELLARLHSEAFRPFDLERGPVFRAALFEREEGDRLALAVHHVAADFWSLAVLVRELGTLYGDGAGAGLPAPALHYTDFARWQEKRLEGPWGDALWEHWRDRLAGAPPLDLATDRPRPPAQTFRGAERRLRLGAQRSAGLQALAAAHGSTLFVALLAAWQALLGRHAVQDDFLVGSPTTGRSAPGIGGRLAGVVGYFVNLVALRADLVGDPTVPELLARARGAALDALEHADFPFARLAERLQPERDASRPPLAQTVIALQRSPAPELAPLAAWAVGEAGVRLELGGLALESIPLASPAAQFDLTLLAAELEGDLALNLQFNTDLFDAITAERMLARLAELLGSMTKDPARRLSELDLLPAAERAQLLAVGATAPGHPDGASAHRLVETHAARWPERLALADATESLTYGELNARANRLARRLAALGVGPETTVAVCLERSAALAVAQLAVLKAGAAYAPLDPAYPAERRAYMVADSGALVVIARGTAETAGVQMLAVEEGAVGDDDPGNLEVAVDGANIAYVIYTSGSTGRPKGVQISHANLANLIAWVLELYALTPKDRAALVVSPSFDVSVWEIWSTLAAGASLHVPDETTRTSPAALVAWLSREKITAGFFPTPLVEALLEEPWPAAARLRVLGCGGDRLRRSPRPGTPFRLLNLYGPAECTVVSIGGEVPESALPLEGDAPIGVPVPGAAIHLLGPAGEEMPLGAPGEIFIGGLGVGRGYLGRPALTAERFVPDPFAATPGARLYRTGDLGRFRPDGAVDFLGRIDRQVKIRGVRIELGEVEAALAALPGVREAVAEARAFGAGAPVLVAWVVPRQGDPAALDVRELTAALRRTLPETLIPTALVPLAALPLTPNGKIDRRALPDPIGLAERAGPAAGPRTAMEERLAGIWGALLGVERIGRGDGFFELGGHSLLAARMISRLHATFGVDLPLAELFASPTLAELAAAVERAQGTAGPEAEPIPPAPRDGDLPLSFAQERLWFLQRLAVTPAYNVPAFLRLRGPLDGEALRAALTGIARRHETLRTTFPEVAGEPVQRVHPAAPFPLVEEDLSGAADPEAAARCRAGEEASRPFDLQAGPLARAILLRLAPGEHVLGLTLHHSVTDGWSTGILLRELQALYGGTELPAPAVQYADYAVWQRAAMTGDALAARLDHWRRRLQGAPAALELPTDRPQPATQSFRGGLARLPLGGDLSAALTALGRSRGATPFMTLLAAFQALLGRMTNHDDLLVGAPAANRGRPEVEGLIGFFVNLLALRADLGGDPPFSALLDRVRRGALEDFAHDDLPFEKVVDAVAPGRDLSRAPLVQVVFALQPALPALELAPGLRVEVEEVHNGTSKFDLTLFVEEGPANGARQDGFEARAEYASDLFDAATAQRLLERLRVLLAGVVADPETPLSRLPLLTAAEYRTLVTEWSASAPGAEPFRVQQRIAEWAARTPERPALVSGAETLTYGEMNARANRLAHALIRLGVGPERVVAVCLERSPAAVVACLAALKAGAAYVPLDPVHPPERLAGMVADVDAAVVVTHETVAARVDFPAPLLRLDRETFAGFPDTDPEVRPDPEGLAYVIFTSGSTGRPKGSGVRHAGLANLCAFYAATTGMGPEDRLSQIAAPGFDVAVGELWPTLVAGASLHFPPDETIVSPPRLLDWLTREGVTICFLPTPLMELVLDEPAAAALALRWFYTGGDRLTRRPPAAAAWKLWNIYGPSECTVVSTSWVLEPAEEGLPSIGVPVPGARVYLLDRAGELAPAGVPAELWVGGVPVGRGYLGRPELTAERYRPDPFGSPGARLYRTGDLARFRADGRLDYLGRLDHQVKIRGFRVELGEVEAALLALPQVREGVVVAREHSPGDKRLVAYVVGREVPPDAAMFRDLLRRTLPEGMVPAAFVMLPALPLSANGKVDRKALPAPDWESAGTADGAPRLPRTLTEELLAGIWAELLGLDRAGVDDDFFASGGHSLLAARLTGRVRAAFGVELPLAEVFAHPTVAGLAREIERARREDGGGALPAPPLVPAHRVGPLPLSFAQERLWFLDQLEAGGPLYNVPVAARLRGPLDAGRLAAAWRGIARRHEALRTTFPAAGGKPVQTVAAEPTLDLERIELDEAAAFSRLDEEARRPFDLAHGPLARALLIRLGADDHLLALTFHHTVADGASMEVLFRELSALYAGDEPAPPAIQYPDYAVWQRGWLQGEVLDAQLAFWRAELTPPPAPLDLPTDRPRPAAQTFRGGAVAVALPAALVRGVRALARRHGATTFMTLLAAWSAVLHRWSGAEAIAIGTPVANRRPEVEGTIGFFVNILPLLTQAAAERPFGDLLARVRGRALGAYAHQDVPFERLVDALAPDRDLSRHPLFQVVLALEDGPGARLRLPGLETTPVPVHTGTAKFELTLALAGDGDGLAGGLEYNTDLFDAATARRMAGNLATLLAGVVEDAGREIADLPLLGADEERQVLVDWNATAAPFPRGRGLHELFATQAARTPDATALIWGSERLTYRELDTRAGQLARRLRRLGVGPEILVGIFTRRTPDMVAAMIAVMRAGGAYVPLDPAYPAERVALLLADTAAPVLITEVALAAALPPYRGKVVLLGHEAEKRDDMDGRNEGDDGLIDPDQTAYTIYTSGSTGLPKAILIRHSSAVAMIAWALAAYPAEAMAGMLASTSICFDISIFEIFAPLACGGTVILADDALALAELPAAGEVRLIDTVPSAMAELLRAGAVPPSVTIVNLAGEPLRRDLVSRVYELPQVAAVYNLYGPSEDTTFSTVSNPGRGEEREPTIGRPIANGRLYVLDRRLRPVPVGVPGEVWIAGEGLARGYLNRPELTADRFRPDPFAAAPGARLYRVGDLARYLPDGELEYLGRLDHQVKIRGFRVELGEIEAALDHHPAVREAAVIAREEGATRALLACVVPAAADEPAAAGDGLVDELRRHLAARLPAYMVPAGFLLLPALPLTPNGKVDRKALARLGPEQRRADQGGEDGGGYLAPRNPIEELLAPLWEEVLGVARVGVHDDFFALGGHSLLGVQLVSRVRDLFGVKLPVRTLFHASTLGELAERIAEEMAAGVGDDLLAELFTKDDAAGDGGND